MLSKLRPRLTYANVVSTACLFIVLGGSAYAATVITGKNVKDGSLTGKDVKNSSLTGGDVKNESLTPNDFNGSVQGPKGDTGPPGPKGDTGLQGPKGDPGSINGVAAGGDLTGTYPNPLVNESSLGKVPNADQLDGVDSSQFQRVGLVQTGVADQTDPDGHAFVITWPELADIQTDGDADADNTVEVLNTGSQSIQVQWSAGFAGVPPGQKTSSVTISTGVPTPLLIYSNDGARNWLVFCHNPGNGLVRCQGIADRVG